jgi:hypothetical protein
VVAQRGAEVASTIGEAGGTGADSKPLPEV